MSDRSQQQRRRQPSARELPRDDSTTHVVTRGELLAATEAALALPGNSPCALFVVNVGRLGSAAGEDAGDDLLETMASRLHLATRSEDLVCRLGGDEFGVLLRAPAGEPQAVATAERLLALASLPVKVAEQLITASVSIGIALSGPGSTVPELLGEADGALKESKAAGGNRFEVFDTAARSAADRRSRLEHELRVALQNNGLELYYQPEVDMTTGEVLAFEALVRWPHPELGLLAADRFVGLAEEEGMVAELGAWALRVACEMMAGDSVPGTVALRVNVSAHQLRGDLLTQVGDVLAGSSLEPQRLCLEITETAVMKNVECSERVLAKLHELGVQLAIDDFGTGLSSLAYLKRFPVDLLKIDRSFVDGVTDPQGRAIVAAVLTLADALDLDVIAEGVETSAQRDALVELGCRRAQGHYFSEALPAAEVLAWLEAQNASRPR